ncbi:MAG: serine/threonine-protein kinase [Gemmatimonadales bacterium]
MPTDFESKATLIGRDDASWRAAKRTSSWTLPPDLLAEAVRRLRASALLYALAFFLAGPFASLLLPESRALLFSEPRFWLPASLSIAGALGVAWLASRRGLSARLKVYAGLGFEILGSFGIAAAQYHDIAAPISYGALGPRDFGLSWVAAWVLLFNVVVPTPPRGAILWAAPSVAAVPLVYAAGASLGLNAPLPPWQFFLTLVFPYLIVLVMVYVSSRVVYGLGAEVRRARELGSYRLVERLGQGGMGEVWRAQHRMLARPAAIKLIRPEMLGGGENESRQLALRRFEREAQATALLRSSHTMELYDFGVADDGTFYYVMELLDGFDLDQLVEQFGPVPPERAVHLLLQICNSLAEAHEAGLIHRDVKPANVYACRYGRELDFVKVLDFGLVKHSRLPEKGADKLTAGDMAGGTPAFMSPEQALGEHRVDSRSDLYAVGCVAYWLLTGTLVFQGETPIETIVMHANQEPEPPSRRTEESIPLDLEAIVLACLDKNPDARPQTADELAARLRSVRLPREWTGVRAREWWSRHRPEATSS